MAHGRTNEVVGLGELLWDVFPDGRRPGGAPANVAHHAGQLGRQGVVVSRVGDDEPGRELRRLVESSTGRPSPIQVDPALPTGRVTVDTSRPDHPSYIIHEPAAWDAIEPTPELDALASRCAAICFGTLAQRALRSRTTIRAVLERAQGALRVFDVNLRQDWYDRERIEASLHLADAIKLNEDELGELDAMLGLPGRDAVARARALLDRSAASLVCVTRAEKGCLLVTADETHDEPGRRVEVVDAVGAGDAFTAAMIVARLDGCSLATTARLANAVGGLVAASPGSMPELRDRFAALRDRLGRG